jgi:hypothetical protein
MPDEDDALTPAERAATFGWLRDARIWALVKQNVRAFGPGVFLLYKVVCQCRDAQYSIVFT